MRKSPVLSEVFSPLGRLEALAAEQFEREIKNNKVAAKAHQLKVKALIPSGKETQRHEDR